MPAIRCPLAEIAERFPTATGMVDRGRGVSFREYDARVGALGDGLRRLGVRAGDRVVIVMSASADYVCLLMALFRLRAVACPVSTRLPEAGRADALRRLRATAVVTADGIRVGDGPLYDWETVRNAAPSLHQPATVDLDQPATVIFTSGSSGEPKAAVHAYRNHYANARASNQNIVLGPGARWLLALPLYHVSGIGIVFRCLLARRAVVIAEADEPLETAIARYGVTHLSLVSTQLYRLLRDAAPAALDGLKAVLMGGSAMPEALVREAVARGLPLFTSYGLTEMATQATTTRPGDGVERLLTAGRPIIDGSVSISPDGEILVRGETLFLGYLDWESPVTGGLPLVRPLTPDGWFSTDDLGYFDGEGYLHVTGRKDNLFISGGENIQPEEIEAALRRLEGVLEAVVVPIADAEFGQRPFAFVRMREHCEINEAAIRRELEKSLPKFKAPVGFLPLPDEPAGGAMKIGRKALEKMAAEFTRRR